jgi:thiamine biosynthesis lipoprotein
MKRQGLFLLTALLLLITALVLFLLYQRRDRVYSSDQFLMDTLVSIKVYGDKPDTLQKAVAAAYREMHRLAELADGFPEPGTAAYTSSDVCRINQRAGIAPVRVDPDIMAMLLLAKKYSELSHGAFDVTVGPLMELWGFGSKNPHIPPPDSIKAARALVGSADLLLDQEAGTVFLRRSGMKIDLGAIAKGYATEKALQVIRTYGVKKALIDAGGNIRVIGTNQKDRPWRIGIKDPRKPEGIAAIVPLENQAAVTSGDYYRFFEVDGKRYHHIIDPRSGYPATTTMAATVIAADAGLADVLSTVFFVLPPAESLALARQITGVDLFLITADRRILHTATLKGRMELSAGSAYRYDQGR